MSDNFLPFKSLRQLFFMSENQPSRSLTVECLLCKKFLKVHRKSSTNLKTHLQRLHPKEFTEYQRTRLQGSPLPTQGLPLQQFPQQQSLPPTTELSINEKAPVSIESGQKNGFSAPGQSVSLQGTLLRETPEMIVVEVAYKDKSFMGTLFSSSSEWISSRRENFYQALNNPHSIPSASNENKYEEAQPLPTSVVASRTRSQTKRKSEASAQLLEDRKRTKTEKLHESISDSTRSRKCDENSVTDDTIAKTSSTDVAEFASRDTLMVKPVERLLHDGLKNQPIEMPRAVETANPDTPESLRELGLSLPFGGNAMGMEAKIRTVESLIATTPSADTSTLTVSTPSSSNSSLLNGTGFAHTTNFPTQNPTSYSVPQVELKVKNNLEKFNMSVVDEYRDLQRYCNPLGHLTDYCYDCSATDLYLNPIKNSTAPAPPPQTSTPPCTEFFMKKENQHRDVVSSIKIPSSIRPDLPCCPISPCYYNYPPFYNYGLPESYSAYVSPYPLLAPYHAPTEPRRSFSISNRDFEKWRYETQRSALYSSHTMDEDPEYKAFRTSAVDSSTAKEFQTIQSDEVVNEASKFMDENSQQTVVMHESRSPVEEVVEAEILLIE